MVRLREPEQKKKNTDCKRYFSLVEEREFEEEGEIDKQRSGDDSGEDPPVPIPNTEVKLSSAEDTWWATARENMTLPVEEDYESSPFFYEKYDAAGLRKGITKVIPFLMGFSV